MASTATIHTYTVIRVAPPEYAERAPYCVAVLESPEGSLFTAWGDGYQDGMQVSIGQVVDRVEDDHADEDPHFHF